MTPQRLEKVIIRRLAARRSATLAQLVTLIQADYWATWSALCRLRQRGLVQPPIRHGEIGRWPQGPARYRLPHRVRKSLDD